MNDTEKMSKALKKYTIALVYADNTLFVLLGRSSGVFICSFTTVTEMIASVSINLVFLISNNIVKIFLKTMRRKKNKHRKIALLGRSKLKNIVKIMFYALTDSDISYDEFTLMINKEQSYFRLKESIGPKEDQLGDIIKDRIIEYGKKTGTNEIFKQNER